MKEQKEQVKKLKHFWCTHCQFYWQTDQYELAEKPAKSDYPYVSPCPRCGKLTANNHHSVAQILKAKSYSTGPRTEEGKKRSSMNAFKTGFYSKKSNYLAPALYGKYAECRRIIENKIGEEAEEATKIYEDTCEYAEQCKNGNLKHCPHQLNLIIKVAAAYENGDVSEIKRLAGISQGRVHVLLDNFYSDVIQEGVTVYEQSKYGLLKKAHPLLDQIAKFMAIAGHTSDQQKMNPKNKDPGEETPGGTMEFKGDPKDFIGMMMFQLEQARGKMAKVAKDKQQDEEKIDQEEKQVEVGPDDNPFEATKTHEKTRK